MSLRLSIVTPAKVFFEGQIDSLTVPLADGGWQLLPNHCPAVAVVEAGTCRLGKDVTIETTGGILRFADNEGVLLCEDAGYSDTWDEQCRAKARQAHSEALRRKQSFAEYRHSTIALAKALAKAHRGDKDK